MAAEADDADEGIQEDEDFDYEKGPQVSDSTLTCH
jgi:hypothetical protein